MSNLTEEQKEQIGAEIDNQGLGYWVMEYGKFEGDDEELKERIREAKFRMNRLKDYLETNNITF
jgi:hypothetical protein